MTDSTTSHQAYPIVDADDYIDTGLVPKLAAFAGAVDTDIYTLTQSLATKAPLASPALTGTPTAPTAAGGTNTTQISTTAFVTAAVAALSSVYQPLASRLSDIVATGIVTSMFAANVIDTNTSLTANSNTRLASQAAIKAYVDNSLAGLVASAPGTLDTLNELAVALGNDPNFATTISTALGNRVRVDVSQGLNSTQQGQARSNIGLGTAATVNTGTSGATIPLLDGANTWSAIQTFSPGANDTIFNRSDSSPFHVSFRQSGTVRGYLGADSTNGLIAYNSGLTKALSWNASTGLLNADSFTAAGVAIPTISSTDTLSNKTIASPTLTGTVAGSVTASGNWTWSKADPNILINNTSGATNEKLWKFAAYTAVNGEFHLQALNDAQSSASDIFYSVRSGASVAQTYFPNGTVAFTGGGILVGAPTGGYKGGGTINAQAVYDDNTLLSCYVLDAARSGGVDLAKWDARVPDRVHPAVFDLVEAGKDKKGGPIFARKETSPERKEARRHDDARKFAARLGTVHDPLTLDGYARHWKEKGHLTSMPNEEKFDPVQGMATGAWIQRLVETAEIQAVLIDRLHERLKAVEAQAA